MLLPFKRMHSLSENVIGSIHLICWESLTTWVGKIGLFCTESSVDLVEDGLIRCPARNRGQIGGNWSPVDWINLVRPLATVNIGLIAQWTWVSGPTRQATLEESILEQMVGLASPCVPVGERGRSQGWKLPSFVCQPAVVAHNCFILYARGHSRMFSYCCCLVNQVDSRLNAVSLPHIEEHGHDWQSGFLRFRQLFQNIRGWYAFSIKDPKAPIKERNRRYAKIAKRLIW